MLMYCWVGLRLVFVLHHPIYWGLNEINILATSDTKFIQFLISDQGHDTTAAAVSWALFQIGLNQDIQGRLHKEMDNIFGMFLHPSEKTHRCNHSNISICNILVVFYIHVW